MNLHKAIRAIHSDAVTINGDTQETIVAKDSNGNEVNINWTQVNNIQWHNTTPISIADIEAKIIEVKEEYNSKQYQRNRAKQYPSIQEQLDMQYWDSVNGTTTWQDKINEIKIKYPKE